jgi:L-rhamnose mutarotase
MEGMPVRWFYPYRYLHLWEAEVPVGINIHAVKTMLLFADKSTGPVFSVVTYTREDWEQQSAEVKTVGERKTWDEVAKYHVFLPEDAFERKPLNDREHWNEELQRMFHIRDWRFRGENFLIMIVQHKAGMKNPAHDSVLDRFVNTLRVVKV